jgi:hypothetical protein
MKKIFTLLAMLMMSLVFTLTACTQSPTTPGGQSEIQNAPFAPWDDLKGGKTANEVTAQTFTHYDYLESTIAQVDESLKDVTGTNPIAINLSNLTSANAPNGTSFANKVLTISAGGTYALSGTLNGAVEVAKIEEDVHIILNGATINTTQALPIAAIVFKETSAKRILTVSQGTTNSIADSTGNDLLSGDGAVLQAKRCSLTINGNGTLNITANGESSTGIKVKKTLNVIGTTININATNNGITSDERIALFDANIIVNALNDGVKTTTQSDVYADVVEYANDKTMGYVYIQNTSLNVTSKDNGLSANSCLYIDNNNSNLIKIKTNNGTPSTIDKATSDVVDGKAINVSGIKYISGTTETNINVNYPRGYAVVITGGKFNLNSNSDAISSRAHIVITGGEITATSGNDAISAERFIYVDNAKVTVTRAYEGFESANIIFKNATINVNVVNDGINSNNDSLTSYDFYVYIDGGNVTVNALGDGIDSNDNIHIKNGNVNVCGPSDGSNSAMNSESGILISGGNVCAVGAKGMVQLPASNSTVRYLSLNLPVAVTGGTEITVYDENGEIYSFTPQQSYQSVIVGLSAFEQNKTYTLKVGVSAYTATFTVNAIALGTNKNGLGNYGFNAQFTPPAV